MKLYNELSARVEAFVPLKEPLTIYVCGITPYDTTHLGHAFTYTSYDVLIRYLEVRGWGVHYVQNVTDIDDDILRKAGQVGEDWKALGDRWTAHFIEDMKALNVRPPDDFPRATDVIEQILNVVQSLLSAGVAYESGGSVYFDLEAYARYGQLSGLSPEQMLPVANERGNRPDDPNKRRPLDFVLWQAQAPGEPAWDSPWGPGRPGWHIECTTMALFLLGEMVDIHGGGADLAFPHHESEIAQAECVTGSSPFVRFWMHTAMVRHEGEKMSKSLGNLVMVRDLLQSWSPDALRLYLNGHHYRQAWSHDPDELAQADRLARKLRAAFSIAGGSGLSMGSNAARASFSEAMDEDLNTPAALQVLERLADEILDRAGEGVNVRSAQEALRELTSVFGVRLDAEGPEKRVVALWDQHLQRFT